MYNHRRQQWEGKRQTPLSSSDIKQMRRQRRGRQEIIFRKLYHSEKIGVVKPFNSKFNVTSVEINNTTSGSNRKYQLNGC